MFAGSETIRLRRGVSRGEVARRNNATACSPTRPRRSKMPELALDRCYPLPAMQHSSSKHRRQGSAQNGIVRISTADLTDQEAQALKEFLELDKNIESVKVGPLETIAESPPEPSEPEFRFLTFDIQAAAEPAHLIVKLLKDNKDFIEALGAVVAIATPAAVGARYVLNQIERFRKTRSSMSLKVAIYDPRGNIIKWVKKKRKWDRRPADAG